MEIGRGHNNRHDYSTEYRVPLNASFFCRTSSSSLSLQAWTAAGPWERKRRKGLVAEVPYYIQMGKNSQNNHTYCPMAETLVGNHNNK